MRELLRAIPEVPMLYRCDTRRWGDLPADQVDAQVRMLGRDVVDRGATRVLLACNSACASSPDLEEFLGVPVARVLDAGLAALAETGARKGITLVTPLTHRLGAIPASLTHSAGVMDVTAVACPGLADAIETGSTILIDQVLASLPIPTDADAALLGCTHYPLIEQRIGALHPNLDIVQPRATHLLSQLMR